MGVADSLLKYLDESPTAFHAVKISEKMLQDAGYICLDEAAPWELKADTGYYVVRNSSSLIAFRTAAENNNAAPYRIATAHTDSPSFKLKEDVLSVKNGMLVAGVEVLGGPIYATWLDRDLAIAGRVMVKGEGGELKTLLYSNPDRKVLLPNPSIHLNREVNKKGFAFNPQTHLNCIIGEAPEEGAPGTLFDLVAEDLGIKSSDILDAELILFDTQKASFNGWNQELISCGRIDNLAMCHAALEAMIPLKGQKATALAALFDNEEVGSLTPHGAMSSFLEQVMERIILSFGGSREQFMQSCAGSFIISADAAHAVHPNFSDLFDEGFAPLMNKGPAVKKNASWNYASTSDTSARYKLLCEKAGVPCQVYINRSDKPAGKTLGPLSAARLGIPAVDVGNPLWSMHSVRETVGVKDQEYMIRSLAAHFNEN